MGILWVMLGKGFIVGSLRCAVGLHPMVFTHWVEIRVDEKIARLLSVNTILYKSSYS